MSYSQGAKWLAVHTVEIQFAGCRQSSPTVGALLAAGMLAALINGPMQQRDHVAVWSPAGVIGSACERICERNAAQRPYDLERGVMAGTRD